MSYNRERDLPKKKAEYWADPQKFRDAKHAAHEASLTPEEKEKRTVRRAKHAEYMRKYYAEHPGYKAAADAKHRKKYLDRYRNSDRYKRLSPERKSAALEYARRKRAEDPEKSKQYSREYYKNNREKWIERSKQRTARPVEIKRLENRRATLKYSHGLTLEQYDAMLSSQGGVCAICGELPITGFNKRLHVDHDHKTEVRRGLLCMKCNHALERLEKYPDWHEKAFAYLKKPR
jgi:hypothetical protein